MESDHKPITILAGIQPGEEIPPQKLTLASEVCRDDALMENPSLSIRGGGRVIERMLVAKKDRFNAAFTPHARLDREDTMVRIMGAEIELPPSCHRDLAGMNRCRIGDQGKQSFHHRERRNAESVGEADFAIGWCDHHSTPKRQLFSRRCRAPPFRAHR